MYLTRFTRPNLQRKVILDSFDQEITKIMNSFFGDDNISQFINKVKKTGDYPKVDIIQDNNQYRIEVSVPGVKKEDLEVELFDENGENYVQISGKMSEEYTKKDNEYFHIRELKRGQFSRVLPVVTTVQGEPTVKLTDGILSLTWNLKEPIEEKKKTKLLEIK